MTAAPPPQPEAERGEPERHSFSLFSWMRRDHVAEDRRDPETDPVAPVPKPEGNE
jgi:hypothetical protein